MVVVHKQFIEFIKLAKRLPLFANKDPRATVKQGKQTDNKHFAHGQENLFFLFSTLTFPDGPHGKHLGKFMTMSQQL